MPTDLLMHVASYIRSILRQMGRLFIEERVQSTFGYVDTTLHRTNETRNGCSVRRYTIVPPASVT